MSDLKALARETAENCSTDHLWHGLAAAAAGIVIRGGMACDPCILSALERVSREGEQRIRELEEKVATLHRLYVEADHAAVDHSLALGAAEQRIKALEGIALGGKLCISQQHADLEQRLKEAREAEGKLINALRLYHNRDEYCGCSRKRSCPAGRLLEGDAPNGSSE